MRSWENFYHTKVFNMRQVELNHMRNSNNVFTVIVTLNWFNPTTSLAVSFLVMMIFDYFLYGGLILGYMKTFGNLLKGMASVPNAL